MAGLLTIVAEEQGGLLREQLAKFAQFDEIATRHFTSAMAVTVEVGKRKVVAELTAVSELNRNAMRSEVGGDFTPLAPVSNPGRFVRGAYEVHGTLDIIGIVGDMKRGGMKLTEVGRGPGKHPPAAKLQDWAERVLGVTPTPVRRTKKGRLIRDTSVGRALSKAIAAKGIRPHPVMEKSGQEIQHVVYGLFDAELVKIAADLGFK